MRWALLPLLVFVGAAAPLSAQEPATGRDITMGPARADLTGKPDIFVQLGHVGHVNALAISPDGRMLASAGDDHVIKLWDLTSGRELRTLAGHSLNVLAVAFTPDGRTLASGGLDNRIKLWDVATGRELRTLTGHSSNVLSLAFTADGRTLVSGSLDKTVKLWDLTTGHLLRTLAGQRIGVSADGRLVSAVDEKTVRIWDMETGRESHSLNGDFFPPSLFGTTTWISWSFAVSPDGRTIAWAGSVDGMQTSLSLWDVDSGRRLHALTGHSFTVTSVAFSPDGQTLASGASDQTVKLWDVATGRTLRTLTVSKAVKSVAFAPDGRSLASGEYDGIVRLWDVATGRQLRVLAGQAPSWTSVGFAPDGKTISGGGRDTVKLWDLATGRQVRSLAGHRRSVKAVAFSSDGRTLAAGDESSDVKLWDFKTGRELRKMWGNAYGVWSVAFTPDGRTIASGGWDNTVKVWDAATGRALTTFTGDWKEVASVAFAPDGRTLAAATDKTIRLWDVAGGRELRTLAGHSSGVLGVAFAPDGRTIASASWDRTIKLWDAATGSELRTLAGHAGRVTSVAFAPDGRTLVSGSGDYTVRLWDVATGRELRVLAGHTDDIHSVAFAPDGRTVGSAGRGSTVRVWDVATVKERVAFISFEDGSYITITPEGYYDASSEKAEENLNVRIGDQVFGISAFRERFYRPDLVKLALTGQSLSQFARIDQVKPAPRVELLDVPTTTAQAQINIKVRLTDAGGGLGDVRLFLNGSAVTQQRSRDLAVVSTPATELDRTYSVRLVHGRNELRVVAFNADNSAQSNPAIAEITATLAAARPALHGVVVGIQDFKNPKFNLKYPVADARQFAGILRQSSAALFQRVNLEVLTTPRETTRENIVRALTDMRQAVGPDDLFVFFVASHGTVDDDEYFLLTSNVGSASTERLKADALSQRDLKDLLGNIPATKKLVVIDTCSAAALGNVLQAAFLTRGMTEETAMKILSRAVGSTVLSASTSAQQALEGYRGHGLFTYVIVEGLRGKADRDGDGFVSTLELATYVDQHVPLLAEQVFKRAQYPMVSPSGQGFPLVKVK